MARCRSHRHALEAPEFIRRFLLHVLPVGFQHLRSYGFLGNRYRDTKLALCRRLQPDLAILDECEFEQAAPQFLGAAVAERFGLQGDPGQACRAPRPGPARRWQALSHEQGADAILHRDAPPHQVLPSRDQGAPLPHPGRRTFAVRRSTPVRAVLRLERHGSGSTNRRYFLVHSPIQSRNWLYQSTEFCGLFGS